MAEQVKLKRIQVRAGKSGFYTRVMESGEYGYIPVDMKETVDGWFDDAPEAKARAVGAGDVGGSSKDESESGNESAVDGGTDSGNGASIGTFSNQVGEEKTGNGSGPVGTDTPITNLADANAAQMAEPEGDDSAVSEDANKTKSDIIKEIESLGVQEFNRSQTKAELLELLADTRKALGE